jgi:hypothetical protein
MLQHKPLILLKSAKFSFIAGIASGVLLPKAFLSSPNASTFSVFLPDSG